MILANGTYNHPYKKMKVMRNNKKLNKKLNLQITQSAKAKYQIQPTHHNNYEIQN